jgi:hypothetical protein
MTPAEMEQEIRNLNQWAAEVAQILPNLATRDDLERAVAQLATKEDLTAFATKEDLRAGIEEAKRYTENLILVTRGEIRTVDDKVTSLAMSLNSLASDVKNIGEQVAILIARRRKPT